MSGPTLVERCSHRRKPGSRQLGTAAYQDEALAVEVISTREAGIFLKPAKPSM
ncbi:hypothetical protein H9X86_10800 [Pseudoflavonifractor capillosus]|uniref:hypothetical protein n=1 Tax=Pseudoflavonifractor capillosus TaxID=106588 RepID=UPI00195EE6F7|nr:hypothetical protein [Pseudoflavonifractor capillosus]MBM6897835.1 hypothetical protein [Pseudoflavonifractor capillosus]